MDLHKLLKPYEIDKKFYRFEAQNVLLDFIMNYSDVHPGFHCYGKSVEDADSVHYHHLVLVYWTDGHRPTLNIFNFIKDSAHEVELKVERKGYEDTWDWIMGEPFND